jgi:hypothetical protein
MTTLTDSHPDDTVIGILPSSNLAGDRSIYRVYEVPQHIHLSGEARTPDLSKYLLGSLAVLMCVGNLHTDHILVFSRYKIRSKSSKVLSQCVPAGCPLYASIRSLATDVRAMPATSKRAVS